MHTSVIIQFSTVCPTGVTHGILECLLQRLFAKLNNIPKKGIFLKVIHHVFHLIQKGRVYIAFVRKALVLFEEGKYNAALPYFRSSALRLQEGYKNLSMTDGVRTSLHYFCRSSLMMLRDVLLKELTTSNSSISNDEISNMCCYFDIPPFIDLRVLLNLLKGEGSCLVVNDLLCLPFFCKDVQNLCIGLLYQSNKKWDDAILAYNNVKAPVICQFAAKQKELIIDQAKCVGTKRGRERA
jgi:hypothetical protein